MKITFIGSGYVGLVSGVMMSHLGHSVTCVDIDAHRINKLKNLESPIFEKDLQHYIAKYGNSDRLQFLHGYDQSIYDSEAAFIAVGTPQAENGDAFLEYIFEAAVQAAKHTNPECVIIIKSTVPPGTCNQVKTLLRQHGWTHQIVSNPEFLREGTAVEDFLCPDRIVIGYDDPIALDTVKRIYKPLIEESVALVVTDLVTAELIKYASNSFLAGKIAFINEMSDLCEKLGANVNHLSYGMGLDHRIGHEFLKAGPGFGGSCFPKDILALQHLASKLKSDFLILNAIIQANSNRSKVICQKIVDFLGGTVHGKKLAVLGLAYKAGTDDLRNSPALPLIQLLLQEGADISAYDPQAMIHAAQHLPQEVVCYDSPLLAAREADAVIVATEWPEFANIDYLELKNNLRSANVVDLRNILDKKMLTDLGYNCYVVGHR